MGGGVEPATGDPACGFVTQIYLTAVTIEDGVYTTHGSIYVWWQPQTLNTIPVWSNLVIPPRTQQRAKTQLRARTSWSYGVANATRWKSQRY